MVRFHSWTYILKETRGESLTERCIKKATHTDCYIHFQSHHPDSVKSGVIECLMKRAVTVPSDTDTLRKETNHIMQAMRNNGYPRTFVKKAIQRVKSKKVKIETDAIQLETTIIPFVNGLSQEIRRITRTAGVRCIFPLLTLQGFCTLLKINFRLRM